jgi:hypothetical protein
MATDDAKPEPATLAEVTPLMVEQTRAPQYEQGGASAR